MNWFKRNFLFFTSVLTAATILGSATVVASSSIRNAEAETSMYWHLRGRKRGFTTEINGCVSAEHVGIFWYDRVFWNGISRGWAPMGINVERLAHTIDVWVEGSGTPSISAGLSVGTSGVSLGGTITTNPTGNRSTYSYSLKNQPKIEVNFSTSGYIWRWSYVGWKTSTIFLVDGYKFIHVDGEANSVMDWRMYRGGIENIWSNKFATRYDNGRESEGPTWWPY